MIFFVYALYSPSHDKIYVGYTSDLEQRIVSHNFLATKGYTIHYRPWTLIHTETFTTKAAAMKREKELKSAQGRRFIWSMIAKHKNM
jgi:putative endonuclease